MILIFWILQSLVAHFCYATIHSQQSIQVYIFRQYDPSSITVQHKFVKHADIHISNQIIQSIKETQKQFLSIESQKAFQNINQLPKVKINIGRGLQSFIKVDETQLVLIEIYMNYLQNQSNYEKYRPFVGLFQGRNQNSLKNSQQLQRMYVIQKGMSFQNQEKLFHFLNATKQQIQSLCQIDMKNLSLVQISDQIQQCYQALLSENNQQKQQISNQNSSKDYRNQHKNQSQLNMHLIQMILTYFLASIIILFSLTAYFIRKAKSMQSSTI